MGKVGGEEWAGGTWQVPWEPVLSFYDPTLVPIHSSWAVLPFRSTGKLANTMSFDKHYPNRKDWRRPYRGSKAFDRSCRPHGSCPYCRKGRQHKYRIWVEPAQLAGGWRVNKAVVTAGGEGIL
jgi:hypothetical protein